jgi:hypothetical protein
MKWRQSNLQNESWREHRTAWRPCTIILIQIANKMLSFWCRWKVKSINGGHAPLKSTLRHAGVEQDFDTYDRRGVVPAEVGS